MPPKKVAAKKVAKADQTKWTAIRQLGRVSDADWAEIKAAVPPGVSFTYWAVNTLLEKARKK